MSLGDLRGLLDVGDLHLDAGDGVALIVEGLGLVEVGVDELGVVLIEAGLEDGDDAEALGDQGLEGAAREREADRRRGDGDALADVEVERLGERDADDDAGHLRDLGGIDAGIRIDVGGTSSSAGSTLW